MTGDEVECQIITVLSTQLGMASHLVVTAMHDRVSMTYTTSQKKREQFLGRVLPRYVYRTD